MLYNLIESWRADRTRDMRSRLFEAARRAENRGILEKTVEMYNRVDQHRQAVRGSYRKRRIRRFLTFNCEPIRWYSYKGIPVEMITVKVQKARQFKAVYDALCDRDVSTKERTDLLTTLRKSLDAHSCEEAFDLSPLLDQAIALLARGIEGLSLDYLNERITRKINRDHRCY